MLAIANTEYLSSDLLTGSLHYSVPTDTHCIAIPVVALSLLVQSGFHWKSNRRTGRGGGCPSSWTAGTG